jgi:hypothetical protein
MLAITSKILALREAKVLGGFLLTSLSNSHHIEESKGLQSCELGGQISFDQWFFSGWPSARLDDFSPVARKAFSTPSKNLVLCRHIF